MPTTLLIVQCTTVFKNLWQLNLPHALIHIKGGCCSYLRKHAPWSYNSNHNYVHPPKISAVLVSSILADTVIGFTSCCIITLNPTNGDCWLPGNISNVWWPVIYYALQLFLNNLYELKKVSQETGYGICSPPPNSSLPLSLSLLFTTRHAMTTVTVLLGGIA